MVAVSPAVSLFDEIEKALAGANASDNVDGGITKRMISSLLYFMKEGVEHGTFIMATANDATKISTELIRRFEELWFVDMPSENERLEILKIHIAKTGRDVNKFKGLDTLAKKFAHDFTGDDIRKCVRRAMLEALYMKRELDSKDIQVAMSEYTPLIKIKPEEIQKLRDWAKETSAKRANEDLPDNIVKQIGSKGLLRPYFRNN
jgi:SpoVK/Ycf46/Vps4 family AAA+-type ATPase